MDSLRFGPLDAADTRRVLPGIVAGIGGYGNCLGLPNIGGEVVFDASYAGNPLVNALCVGVMRHERSISRRRPASGTRSILYGASTGGDGIGGVSVLASETFDADGAGKRPSVQVGDPFMEKLLIECTLELFAEQVWSRIQDLGGAGLSCATSELASAGDGGMRVWLDRVPAARLVADARRDPDERVAGTDDGGRRAGDVGRFLAICAKWDVDATVVGEVTDTERLVVEWNGETIVDVPPRTVAHEGPVYERPYARPSGRTPCRRTAPKRCPGPPAAPSSGRRCCGSRARRTSPTSRWVTDQYDRYVQGNTVLAQPEDAGMVRVDEATGLGIAVSTDCNGRFTKLDPYAGAQLALAEAYRNVAAPAARPLAVTDCLNFGSPEDPEVMWQFAEATAGSPTAAEQLGIPVTGGNVSFYNQTGDVADPADPGGRGARRDRRRPASPPPGVPCSRPAALPARPDRRGAVRLRPGRMWCTGISVDARRTVDLDAERALADLLVASSHAGLIESAHDLADGGLAQALLEACLRHGVGASVTIPAGMDPFVALVQRVERALPGGRSARDREPLHRPLRRPGRAAAAAGRRRPGGRAGVARGRRPVPHPAESFAPPGPRRCRRRWTPDQRGALDPCGAVDAGQSKTKTRSQLCSTSSGSCAPSYSTVSMPVPQ